MTLRSTITLNMSAPTDNTTLHPRPADYVDLPPLPPWKGSPNATFLERVQSDPVAYGHYAQVVNENLQRMLKHIDTQGPKFIEILEEQRQYASAQESENENLSKQYDQSQAYINQLKGQLAIAQANAQTSGSQFSGSQRSPKAPEPPEFTGDDKSLTRSFIFQARNKVTANRDHFTLTTETETQLSMVAYIFSRFRGTASKRALALVSNNQFVTADNFFEWIERAFGDPDPVATAQAKIRECKQKNRPFQEYLAEFSMYINDTGYNETAQKTAFYDGLSTEIKQYLVTVPWRNMDLVVFQEECGRLENAYKSIPTYTPRNKGTTNTQRNSTPNATASASTSNHNHSHSPAAGGDPMDLSANRVRRGPLTEAEKQHRRESGLCLYCGEPGHLARNCPRKPTLRSVSFGNTPPASSQPAPAPGTPAPANKVQGNA